MSKSELHADNPVGRRMLVRVLTIAIQQLRMDLHPNEDEIDQLGLVLRRCTEQCGRGVR